MPPHESDGSRASSHSVKAQRRSVMTTSAAEAEAAAAAHHGGHRQQNGSRHDKTMMIDIDGVDGPNNNNSGASSYSSRSVMDGATITSAAANTITASGAAAAPAAAAVPASFTSFAAFRPPSSSAMQLAQTASARQLAEEAASNAPSTINANNNGSSSTGGSNNFPTFSLGSSFGTSSNAKGSGSRGGSRRNVLQRSFRLTRPKPKRSSSSTAVTSSSAAAACSSSATAVTEVTPHARPKVKRSSSVTFSTSPPQVCSSPPTHDPNSHLLSPSEKSTVWYSSHDVLKFKCRIREMSAKIRMSARQRNEDERVACGDERSWNLLREYRAKTERDLRKAAAEAAGADTAVTTVTTAGADGGLQRAASEPGMRGGGGGAGGGEARVAASFDDVMARRGGGGGSSSSDSSPPPSVFGTIHNVAPHSTTSDYNANNVRVKKDEEEEEILKDESIRGLEHRTSFERQRNKVLAMRSVLGLHRKIRARRSAAAAAAAAAAANKTWKEGMMNHDNVGGPQVVSGRARSLFASPPPPPSSSSFGQNQPMATAASTQAGRVSAGSRGAGIAPSPFAATSSQPLSYTIAPLNDTLRPPSRQGHDGGAADYGAGDDDDDDDDDDNEDSHHEAHELAAFTSRVNRYAALVAARTAQQDFMEAYPDIVASRRRMSEQVTSAARRRLPMGSSEDDYDSDEDDSDSVDIIEMDYDDVAAARAARRMGDVKMGGGDMDVLRKQGSINMNISGSRRARLGKRKSWADPFDSEMAESNSSLAMEGGHDSFVAPLRSEMVMPLAGPGLVPSAAGGNINLERRASNTSIGSIRSISSMRGDGQQVQVEAGQSRKRRSITGPLVEGLEQFVLEEREKDED